jgi:hypothetical protein
MQPCQSSHHLVTRLYRVNRLSSPWLQSCTTSTSGPQQKSSCISWVPTNISSRNKAVLPSQDPEMEVDPWTLLEDGTSCPSASSGSSGTAGDHAAGSRVR